jgi:hypothetical protein
MGGRNNPNRGAKEMKQAKIVLFAMLISKAW